MPSRDHYWLPFTPNRSFAKQPQILVRAEGLRYWNEQGDELLDGCSGLFCSALGHARPEIGEAMAAQYRQLDFSPPFRFAQPAAFELAADLAQALPGDLDRIFFVNSGSEAVDTALKIALRYHHARGDGERQRFVTRDRGYHGVNFGGVSLSGMANNREFFGPGLPGVLHKRNTLVEANRFTAGEGEHGVELADDLLGFVEAHGAESIAACVVEPIAGSTGILVPPRGYLSRLREICDEHGILLIFDEVITGFGRTGKAFAADTFGVLPDIITVAKALTNGAIPMGAVAVRRGIYETIAKSTPEGGIEFFHGYTYSAHPVACAAGLATLKIFREESTFERAAELAPYFLERVFELEDIPQVVDIRGFGLLAGIDLDPTEVMGERGSKALERLFASGLVIRVTNDTLILAPALVSDREHIDGIVDRLRATLPTL
jgi:beta-alanine--pyruvate transaminase